MVDIQNPGSALGEAIGAHMEFVLNRYLEDIVSNYSCRLITKGPRNPRTGKDTKLLLYDKYNTDYNLDAVVTNEHNKPLILIEYKYIRYKKHNRDKGSWLCTAHGAIRKRYNSIRSSIAILAGNWSGSSIAMMKSHDINIFLIPFETITQLLKEYDIVFDWGEKDRHIANESWKKYNQLKPRVKLQIAERMISVIKDDVEEVIEKTLDETTIREVDRITIEVHTNIGEIKIFEFVSIDDAISFLEDFSFDKMFNQKDSYTIFDVPDNDG